MSDPDRWKFSNEDGKLDRQYGGGGRHKDFVASVKEATKIRIESLLADADSISGLECDGFSRVASYILTKAEIPHRVLRGRVETLTCNVAPHFWLEAYGWRIDYRLRMWAGPEAPHGVFDPQDETVSRFASYTAEATVKLDTPDWMYTALTGRPA